jgi:hypothetical protein
MIFKHFGGSILQPLVPFMFMFSETIGCPGKRKKINALVAPFESSSFE